MRSPVSAGAIAGVKLGFRIESCGFRMPVLTTAIEFLNATVHATRFWHMPLDDMNVRPAA